MCTVTFIPVNNKIFITANRDEKHWRPAAVAPSLYSMQTGKILFPKDTEAGGTWFAVHENGNAVVFLNGAWVRHLPRPPYHKSRGLILLDLVDSETPFNVFLTIKLNNIEPFTAVIWDDGLLFECRWDGSKKFHRPLNADMPHIWSSVTLYDEKVIAKRTQWFSEWLKKNPLPSQEDILHFHQFTGDGDSHNDLLMNRDGLVFTVSVTSLECTNENALLQYLDITNKKSHRKKLLFTKATAEE